jgi:steroid delta-isomerase-like uncharacterized protein
MAQTDTAITRVAEELLDAFNQNDWDRLRGLVANDLVYTETGTGRRIEGADAYLQLCESWKRAFPDTTGTTRAIIAGDGIVAHEIYWEGTHTGPLESPGGTIEASGRPTSTEASGWLRFQGETISEIHHHIDLFMLLQQIGALPASPQ